MSEDFQDWELAEREEARKMVDQLSGFVNTMSRRPKDFVAYVMSEHRTLQQSMFNLFMSCVEAWSKQEHYDLRNEATVLKSRQIVERMEGNLYGPLI